MTTLVKTGTILIVDDNPTNLDVLSNGLASANFIVAVASNGEEAIEQVQYKPPDLILLDIMMPGIDGFETCRRLKADPSTATIPIIFMTALSDLVDKVKGLNLGAVDYITKPFQFDEVLSRVRIHLQLYHAKQILEKHTIELTQTLQQLYHTQAQLIQAEKMSSLGQLVAGVAHEINNPISFIFGNLIHMEEYITKLVALFQQYQQFCPVSDPNFTELVQEIELDYILEDLPQLVCSMKRGATRIQDIVVSLRNFSRLDESELKTVDIHEGIESALLILQSRFTSHGDLPDIQVIKRYGKLPKAECYPSQLNQVVMNILNNAIDALKERSETIQKLKPGQIIIETAMSHQSILISISDNGMGIPKEIQSKLFDPFFTTKHIGKGIGLGLSVSYQIVNKHGGSLTCTSEPDEYTQFCIEIPIFCQK